MAEFIATRKLRFRDDWFGKAQSSKTSSTTEEIFRTSQNKSLLKVLDADPEKATAATRSLMWEYLGIK